jgi:hypothetical protein
MAKTQNQNPDAPVWGIHAGRTGDADVLFLKQNCIAIGWDAMGDLSKLAPDREAFKQRYVQAYPNAKKGGVATVAGVPYRFLHEMRAAISSLILRSRISMSTSGALRAPIVMSPRVRRDTRIVVR